MSNNASPTHVMPLSSVFQQKLVADLESDQSRLTNLVSKRIELKEALRGSTLVKQGCWIATRGGSFVLYPQEQAEELILEELDIVENEILEVCQRVKEAAG
jgi:hypothetical protein